MGSIEFHEKLAAYALSCVGREDLILNKRKFSSTFTMVMVTICLDLTCSTVMQLYYNYPDSG